jgi:hypothetical protein
MTSRFAKLGGDGASNVWLKAWAAAGSWASAFEMRC